MRKSRTELKNELLSLNHDIWADWDKYEVAHEDPERNFISKKAFDKSGLASVLTWIKADGMTMEMIRPYYDDPLDFLTKFKSDRIKVVELEQQEGLRTFRGKYMTPFPLF